ncbi:Ig-like domain-containing protein [Streptococcus macacae]|nr:Ig-like domain-containing protein [Streptococcus macacae]
MKKKLLEWLSLFLIGTVAILGGLLAGKASAAEQGDVITKMYVTNREGNPLTDEIDQWEQFRLNADFKLPNNTVKAGDTTTVSLPKEITFATSASFDVQDSSGNVVAKAVVDKDTKKVTLTYTDFVENHSDISGTFFFYIRADHTQITEKQQVPLNITVNNKVFPAGSFTFKGITVPKGEPIEKSGWQNASNPRIGQYYIAVNRANTNLKNTKIVDKLQGSYLNYVPGSFIIEKGKWVYENGDWALKNASTVTDQYPAKITGSSFSIDFGDLDADTGFAISYQVNIPYTPVDGEAFGNSATLTANNRSAQTVDSKYYFLAAGGQAEGYTYNVKIKKVNEQGQPLASAVFDLIRVKTGQTVGQLTTDNSGEATLGGLLKDAYILRETSAPKGYVKADDISVSADDFDTGSKTAQKTITNKAEVTTTTETSTTESSTVTTPETSSTTNTTTESTTLEDTTTENSTTTVTEGSTTTTEVLTETTDPTTTAVENVTTATSTTSAETTVSNTNTTSQSLSTSSSVRETSTTDQTTVIPQSSASTISSNVDKISSSTKRSAVEKTAAKTSSSQTKKSHKWGLPSTGEYASVYLSLLGLLLISAVGIYHYKKNSSL